ncbi:MAG: DUF692 domain-containing protein [Deltaproteobacteria bacterium]|nr:MAG: DUF692 domain-containing protein [Deltaproteobacteria bacterium]
MRCQIRGGHILVENVSRYVTFGDSTMPEWTFLCAGAEAADCGILLGTCPATLQPSCDHALDSAWI